MAIRLLLTSSENSDNILDSIHSPADVAHLIAKRTAYTKSQQAENLTKDIHHDDSTNSQCNVNYVNSELIDFETCLTQDSQEDIAFIDNVDVLIEFIEGKVGNYSTELSYYLCTCRSRFSKHR